MRIDSNNKSPKDSVAHGTGHEAYSEASAWIKPRDFKSIVNATHHGEMESQNGTKEETENTCSQGETDEVRVVWTTVSQEE